MSGRHVCKKHEKRLEAFCFDCKGKNEPMCAICLCDHQKEQHKTKATHITTIINEVLIEVGKGMKNTEEQRRHIDEYSKQTEDIMALKEKTRHQLEEKLQNLRDFYKKQKALAASTNSALLNCNEKILKEAQKCEYQIKEHIKNPKKVEHRVKEMVSKEDYWLAYEEAQRALAEDTTVDDKEIKAQFGKCQEMMKNYQDQLLALDIISLHKLEHKKILDTNTTIQG